MSISRFELNQLQAWAKQPQRKPIVLRGARQVGKSTLVQLLAETSSLKLLTINFEQQPELAELFSSNNPTQILQLLQMQISQQIIPGETLLFLDEIQMAAHVLATLRYFYEEMPTLHVMAAGSLLDFALAEARFSMPVGRVEYLFLGPLRFEEFLVALNEVPLLEFIQHHKISESYPLAIHERLMNLLQSYMIIGGMPEAVAAYAANQDYTIAERIKHSILNTYQDDFAKYSTPATQTRLRKIFQTLPALVGNKLKYSYISHDEKSIVIAQALEKLCAARVAYMVKHSACNGVPLGAETNDKIFKPLFLDVGLLCSILGLNLLDLSRPQDITLVNSGSVAEQFIGQHLLYMNPSYQEPQLYYWVREKKSSLAEIDYVISAGTRIIPIEVKSGKTGTLRSLHYFLQEKSLDFGVTFNAQQPHITPVESTLATGEKIHYRLLSLPLYFVGQLKRILGEISL